VLAAGTSSRLGRPKQLLDVGGIPLLQHVVDASVASPLDEIVIVLGHAAGEIAQAIRTEERVRMVLNHRYATGQSSSLVAGLRASDRRSDAAVILLGDQLGIRLDAIVAVIRAWHETGGPVVQASYGGKPGHPTLFGRSVWAELEAVTGDEGARRIIASHPEWRSLVEIGGDPPDDVDTEDDYRRIRASFDGP
jgi:molybdenum cofactor cytidylyltransferase